ncbi:MAG: DEAD/DEAH box helicase, partial [Chitinophagales bacterium]
VLPNQALKSYKQEVIIQKIKQFQNTILSLKLKALDDYSFDILKEYIKNEPLLKEINIQGFKSWKSNKQIRKNWQKDEAIRAKIKSEMAILKPKTIKILPQQVDIIKNYLLSNQFLKKWRDHSGKDLDDFIGKAHPNWLGKSITEKLEAIFHTERYFTLESELGENSLAYADQPVWAQNGPIYEYLENKINAKIPFYEFYYKFWVRSSTKLDYTKFELLISSYKDLINCGIELDGILIGKFTKDYDPTTITLLSNEYWVSINSKTYSSRSEFESQENNSNKIEPVLTNYSNREIASFAKYVRNEYPKFIAKNRYAWEQEYYGRKRKELNEFLLSRSRSNTYWRQEFKSAIQYIDRLWSEKRKKPTKLAYLNQIGFESAQWLQPMTIASAELVSQYLPLTESFDLIIIDESSQTNIVSAIPSLARAKSAVIVGDRKQLSPTRFFRNVPKEIESYESLLELAEQKLVSHSLVYHYRSKSSNLIEYSNANFYNNQLQVGRYSNPSALEYIYIDGQFIKRRNLSEAEAIVDYLANKIDVSNNNSLGIIAFSIQQKECIEDKIDDEMAKNGAFRAKISILKENKESLFVKNLENVQGDERDIILICTGYGKNEN